MSAKQINITLGTAGHIDHGKTALIKCLTGCDTDRLKEEKERGMSIDLGFAPCTITDLQVGIVDVPGHENFIKTMVAGASGMDGVIFVVAADDGIMPQTREHLDILTLLGIQSGLVALTKVDRVEPDLVKMVQSEIEDFLKGTFLEGSPIIPVSSVTGDGFGQLYQALVDLVGSISPKRVDGVFRLPVERVFSVKGYGTVVCGIPVSGSARIDDEILLLPRGLRGRIKAIEVYNHTSDSALAGQCAALNIRQWDYKMIKRGNVVTVPEFFVPHEWFLCKLRLLPLDKLFLKNGASVKFHTGTSEVLATVYLIEGDGIRAGDEAFIQIKVNEPLVVGPGDRFVLRALSPVATIGGGTIIEAVAKRLKRRRPDLAEDLRERSEAVRQDKKFVEYCVEKSDGLAVGEPDLSFRAKVLPSRLQVILKELISEGQVIEPVSGLHMHRKTVDAVGQRITDLVKDFHRAWPESPGMDLIQIQQSIDIREDILESLVALLKKEGKLTERNRRLALPGYHERLADEDRKLMDMIESFFKEQMFNPPSYEQVAEKTRMSLENVDRLLRLLVEHERLVQVADNLIFHREAIDYAREKLEGFIKKEGKLLSVEFKYLIDTTRKFALPLLDYFDRIGVTRRVGHTRYLRVSKAVDS